MNYLFEQFNTDDESKKLYLDFATLVHNRLRTYYTSKRSDYYSNYLSNILARIGKKTQYNVKIYSATDMNIFSASTFDIYISSKALKGLNQKQILSLLLTEIYDIRKPLIREDIMDSSPLAMTLYEVSMELKSNTKLSGKWSQALYFSLRLLMDKALSLSNYSYSKRFQQDKFIKPLKSLNLQNDFVNACEVIDNSIKEYSKSCSTGTCGNIRYIDKLLKDNPDSIDSIVQLFGQKVIQSQIWNLPQIRSSISHIG